MNRTAPGLELPFRAEGLAPDAVPAFVRTLVKCGRVSLDDPLDQCAYADGMMRRGRANERVVRDAQRIPGVAKQPADMIRLGKRCETRDSGGASDLEAVVVGPDEQANVVAAKATVPRDGVGADLLEGVPEMRLTVGVLDGGRDVEVGHGRAPGGDARERARTSCECMCRCAPLET